MAAKKKVVAAKVAPKKKVAAPKKVTAKKMVPTEMVSFESVECQKAGPPLVTLGVVRGKEEKEIRLMFGCAEEIEELVEALERCKAIYFNYEDEDE